MRWARSRRVSCRPSGFWARLGFGLGPMDRRFRAAAARRDAERYAEIAAEFVRLKVDVIVTTAPAVRSSLGSISSWRRRMRERLPAEVIAE